MDPDLALIHGFQNLLPQGIIGLATALLFSPIMSSLDTYIYTGASSIVQDFLKLKKNRSGKSNKENNIRTGNNLCTNSNSNTKSDHRSIYICGILRSTCHTSNSEHNIQKNKTNSDKWSIHHRNNRISNRRNILQKKNQFKE